jgi:tRNA G10  N-methylase Trm11
MLVANTSSANGNAEAALLGLLERYEKYRKAVTVNFRKLVDWIPVGERATHYMHPYPAKLLPQIPAFFLANSLLSKPGDTVLDPFCGSGTVLLESVLHGRRAFGADANPLARLIANAKVSGCTPGLLRQDHSLLMRRARSYRRATPPDMTNIGYWFYPHVIAQLARLRGAIDTLSDPDIADFFRVCFSVCVRRVSLADPRLSVPVRLRENQYPAGHPFRDSSNARLRKLRRQDVFAEFGTIVENNIDRVEAFHRMRVDGGSASVVGTDARKLSEPLNARQSLADKSVDLVVTSPPYVSAQKYVRASSLSIGWLGLTNGHTLRQLEDQNIGREHFTTGGSFLVPKVGIPDADRRLGRIAARNPLRALIAATYLVEMQEALREAARVLKPGGHILLVAANNRVCGSEFYTQKYLQTFLERLGLVVRLQVVDAIKSRGLMTRRNTTASVIAREWALLFQKPAEDPNQCQI